jgi:hypothetical protein
MQIVDAQMHTWGTGLPSNLTHEQRMKTGLDAAVIHPPGWSSGSMEMAFKAVRDCPRWFAIMRSRPLAAA